MSGEGKSVSFKRTSKTTKSNKELHEEFSKIIFYSPVTRHMKFYGERWSGHQGTIELYEHGDKSLPDWRQEDVAIKDTFQIGIHLYESWYEDDDLYESYKRNDSFVSLAKKFAKDNNLTFFPNGFPSSWIKQQDDDTWKHFIISPTDKNIDKICELWLDEDWDKASNEIEKIMEQA